MNISVEEAIDKLRPMSSEPAMEHILVLVNEFLQQQERIADNLSMIASSLAYLERALVKQG